MGNPGEVHTTGALALMLRMSRWFGVAPLSFKRERDGWRISVYPKLTIYGYVLITLLNTLLIFEIIRNVIPNEQNTDKREKGFMWAMNLCLMLMCASAGAYWTRNRIYSTIACLNIMGKINSDLSLTSQKWYNTSEGKKKLFFVVWSVIFMFLCAMNIVLSEYYENRKDTVTPLSGVMLFINSIVLMALYWIVNVLAAQFVMVAMSIVSSLRAINEHLKIILQDVKMETLSKKEETAIIGNEKPLNMFESLDSREMIKLYRSGVIPVGAAHESVRQLGMMFASLCDVQREVNRCHGPVLILLLTTFTLRLIFMPFYFLTDLFLLNTVSEEEYQEAYFNLLVQALWCAAYCFSLMMIIEPGEYTQGQIGQTKELLSTLLRYSYLTREPLRVELELFLQQLTLNKVVYSPLGLTPLSRSVAAGLLGSIVTYMIVIIQLLQMNNS